MDVLSNLCRTCMCESSDLSSAFDIQIVNNETISISEMLLLCTSVEINLTDQMPSNICHACSCKISEAYSFRQQALETNSMFFSCFENIKTTDEFRDSKSPDDLFEIDDSKIYLGTEDVDIIEQIDINDQEQDEIIYNVEPQYHPDLDDSVFDPHNNLFKVSEIEFIKSGLDKNDVDANKVDCLEILSCDEDDYEEKLKKKRAQSKIYRSQKKYKPLEKNRLCNVCGKSFNTGNKFRAHYKLHFPEKCHQCRYCEKFFAHKFMWVEHERTHTDERPFECLLCNYSAKQKTSLQIHMRTHTGDRPYKCPHCDHKSLTSSQRLQHIERVHTANRKKFTCDECGKEYTSKSRLKEHEIRHTDAPRPEFPCDYCDKTFAYRKNCLAHARKHHKEFL